MHFKYVPGKCVPNYRSSQKFNFIKTIYAMLSFEYFLNVRRKMSSKEVMPRMVKKCGILSNKNVKRTVVPLSKIDFDLSIIFHQLHYLSLENDRRNLAVIKIFVEFGKAIRSSLDFLTSPRYDSCRTPS